MIVDKMVHCGAVLRSSNLKKTTLVTMAIAMTLTLRICLYLSTVQRHEATTSKVGSIRDEHVLRHVLQDLRPPINNQSRPLRLTTPARRRLAKKSMCTESLCTEFLTKEDLVQFRYCVKKTELLEEPQRSHGCHFMNGAGRNPIALASYSGSGNTWVRGLLQGVSGLCTGGIYCDVTLRQRGFPGERIASGTVLVVKTHQTNPWWTGVDYTNVTHTYFKKRSQVPVYSSAIFIVRNPFDAIVADRNRKANEEKAENHIMHLGKEEFGDNEDWNNWVHNRSLIWKKTVLAWVVDNHNHPVLVIRYEDLMESTTTGLRKMLDFLRVPYTEKRLYEVTTQDYKEFKRKHYEEFDHYTREQRDFVRSVINDTLSVLKSRGLASVCNIEEYLQ